MEITYIIGVIGLVLVFLILWIALLDADEDCERWRETNFFGDKK